MSLVVLDASVIGPLLIPDEAEDEHDKVIPLLDAGRALVPEHWRLEVASLGRNAVLRGRLKAEEFHDRLADLDQFKITIDASTGREAWGRTTQLALDHRLTVYDAAYLELAIRTGAALLSADAQLVLAAKSQGVAIL